VGLWLVWIVFTLWSGCFGYRQEILNFSSSSAAAVEDVSTVLENFYF